MKKLGLLPADRKKTLFELEQDRQRKRTRAFFSFRPLFHAHVADAQSAHQCSCRRCTTPTRSPT